MSLQKVIFVFLFVSSVLAYGVVQATPHTYSQAATVCNGISGADPEIEAVVKACMGKASIASTMCFENTSPAIKTGMTVVGSLLSAIKMASPADACSGFSKAMDAARNVVSAFNLACGGAHALCDSSCSSAMGRIEAKKAENIQKINTYMSMSAYGDASAAAAAEKLTLENVALVKQKTCAVTLQKTCDSYTAQLTAGAAGIVGLVMQSQTASKCNEQLSPSPTPVDCNLAANATLAQCICEKTPRASGCAGYTSTATSSADKSSFNNSSSGNKDEAGGGGFSSGGNGNGDLPVSAGGSGGGLASGGQGGNGVDGGQGSAAGAAKKDAVQKTGINTNILGGDYGGGGGSRSGGRSSTDEAMKSQYKNYLPGEKSDPLRSVANDSNTGPLTGSGGKTNWDKVRERYDENY